MDKAPDNKALASRRDIPFPFESEIARRLSIADICHYAPGMLNKLGKEGKTSWDSFGYALMMAHNTYCHITAVQRANNLADIEYHKVQPNWKQWRKVKDRDMSDEYSDWVPRNILYFNRFVEELFQSQTPMDMIEQAKPMLNDMMGMRLRGGNASNTFSNLFAVEELANHLGVEDLNDPDDEALVELEAQFNESKE